MPVEEVEEIFECPECRKEFDSEKGLNIHKNVHKGELKEEKEETKPRRRVVHN